MRGFSGILSIKRILFAGTLIMVGFLVAFVGLYSRLLASVVEENVQTTFESLADNVESRLKESINGLDSAAKKFAYSSDIQAVTFFTDPEEYFRASSAAEDIVSFVMSGNPNISAIFISWGNDRSFSSDTSMKGLFSDALKKNWPNGKYDLKEPFFDTLFHNDENSETPYVIYFYPFYNIRTGEYERQNCAVCAILCNVNHLVSWLDIDNSENSAMAVVYKDNIVSSSRSLTQSQKEAIRSLKSGRGTIMIDRVKYLSNSIKLPQLGWEFVYITPENELLGGILGASKISFFVLIGVVLLLCIMMACIITLITRPVQNIVYDMRAVRRGEMTRIKPAKVLELQELANGINRTLDSVEDAYRKEHEAQNKLYQAMLEQNVARLHAYRSQINPHFLFNTLECMRSMARHYKAKPLEGLVRSLSLMFRYSLHSNIIVPLRHEIDHVKNYMSVMQYRARNNYELRISIPEEIMNCSFLAMCLQPIVENSMKHAFVKKKGTCIVQIQAKVEKRDAGDMLCIRISDNGSGIPEKKLEQLRIDMQSDNFKGSSSGIGLHNIAKRLKLVFGNQSVFSITSREGFYTCVTVKIPKNPMDIAKYNTNQIDEACF